jgi:hypothetical protein
MSQWMCLQTGRGKALKTTPTVRGTVRYVVVPALETWYKIEEGKTYSKILEKNSLGDYVGILC